MKKRKSINKILPSDIISEILSRLPTKSVLISKVVCKKWKQLIHHRSFPEMHLARLDSTDSGKLRYVCLDDDRDNMYSFKDYLYYFEKNDTEDWHLEPIRHGTLTRFDAPFGYAYILLGSFNGLICLYGHAQGRHGPAVIMNPVTKEYATLPLDEISGFSHLASGFGYVASTNEYKIVRICMLEGEPDFVHVQVYTLKSGNGWRHVGRFRFGFRFYTDFFRNYGVFWNGALHWRNSGEGKMVVAFDLVDEKFREHIPPPSTLQIPSTDYDDCFLVIGVSGGGILYYADSEHAWLLMNKEEEHQSWGWNQVTSLDQKEPFAFMVDAEVIRYDQGTLETFESNTSTWQQIGNSNLILGQAYPHKHTLVSLEDLGEDVDIMESDSDETTDSD